MVLSAFYSPREEVPSIDKVLFTVKAILAPFSGIGVITVASAAVPVAGNEDAGARQIGGR